MSGEIKYFKDSEGVSRQVDYEYLANKPFAAPTSSDEGKALVVDSTGDPVWASVLPVSGTDGAVLTLESGSPTWGQVMPSHTSSDAGKALVVNENGNGTLWGRIIPTYDHSVDDGKVLTVDGTQLAWARQASSDTSLPTHSQSDNGKVLTVDDGDIAWSNVLPAAGLGVDGRVLTIDASGTDMSWVDPSSIGSLPGHTSGDAGKFAMVDEYNQVVWGNELPSHTSSECQKVLRVSNSYGDLEWADLLPSFDGYADAGKVLAVAESSFGNPFVWAAGVPSIEDADVGDVLAVSTSNEFGWEPIVRVPAYTSSDAGKTLKVNANGDGLEWS